MVSENFEEPPAKIVHSAFNSGFAVLYSYRYACLTRAGKFLLTPYRRWSALQFQRLQHSSPSIISHHHRLALGLGYQAAPCLRIPRCRSSHASYWTTSSTIYTTVKSHSGTAASSPNPGSLAPEHTFSPRSISGPRRAGGWNRGRRRFQTPQPLPRITPKLSTLAVPKSSRPQVVRWRVSLALSYYT